MLLAHARVSVGLYLMRQPARAALPSRSSPATQNGNQLAFPVFEITTDRLLSSVAELCPFIESWVGWIGRYSYFGIHISHRCKEIWSWWESAMEPRIFWDISLNKIYCFHHSWITVEIPSFHFVSKSRLQWTVLRLSTKLWFQWMIHRTECCLLSALC